MQTTILNEWSLTPTELSSQAGKSSISSRQLAGPVSQWWFQTLTQLPALPPVTALPELMGFPGGSSREESACNACGFNPQVRKMPWRRKWQLIPVFLPGESHGQRSLVGYSSWGHRVGHDWVTEHTHTHTQTPKQCSVDISQVGEHIRVLRWWPTPVPRGWKLLPWGHFCTSRYVLFHQAVDLYVLW